MRPIEELRAAYAATTQGEWEGLDVYHEAPYVVADQGKEWNNPVVCNLYEDVTPGDSVTIGPWYEQTENAAANAAFIALTHNEFPAMLDEIETLRHKLTQWESVFGHLGDTPDACGNAIIARQDEADAEIERLRVLAGHGRWEITASDDSQYLYVQHDWAGGHGQIQIKAEAEGYVVDIFDNGDNCVASTSAMYHELDNEE